MTPAILRQHHYVGSSGNLGAKVGRCPWGLNLIQHKEKSIREINADLVANCLISRELRNQNKYSKKTYKKVIHKKIHKYECQRYHKIADEESG